MARCGACSSTIIFGGAKAGSQQFCNNNCLQRGQLLAASRQLPDDLVRAKTAEIYRGVCPKCQGPGPVDVQMSYRIWSALFMTQWVSRTKIACRSCGRKQQFLDTLFCLFLGWWGFPWGLIMTPVQISRNLGKMFGSETLEPSPNLENAVRIWLASNPGALQSPAWQAAGKLTG